MPGRTRIQYGFEQSSAVSATTKLRKKLEDAEQAFIQAKIDYVKALVDQALAGVINWGLSQELLALARKDETWKMVSARKLRVALMAIIQAKPCLGSDTIAKRWVVDFGPRVVVTQR